MEPAPGWEGLAAAVCGRPVGPLIEQGRLLGLALAGCATTQDQHLDKSVSVGADAKEAAPPPEGYARVYLLRPKAWSLGINPILVAVPPIYSAVDGRLVAAMPLGSHVVLTLQPGLHTFRTYMPIGGGLTDLALKRWDLSGSFESGKTYYVAHKIGFPNHVLVFADESDGRKAMDTSSRAKFIHNPAGADEFERKFAEIAAKRSNARKAAIEQTANSLLPSSQTVGNVLEGIAVVAIAALVIVGGVAVVALGGAGAMTADAPPASAPQVAEAPRRVTTGSGGVIEMSSGTRRETVVTNYSTGTKYRIEGDRVTGSDGSRYRLAGTQLISDSGASYTVVGNSVFGADGSSCDRIGDKIYCKNIR